MDIAILFYVQYKIYEIYLSMTYMSSISMMNVNGRAFTRPTGRRLCRTSTHKRGATDSTYHPVRAKSSYHLLTSRKEVITYSSILL